MGHWRKKYRLSGWIYLSLAEIRIGLYGSRISQRLLTAKMADTSLKINSQMYGYFVMICRRPLPK